MPRTSITFYPQKWYEFDEPYAGIGWVEEGGGGQASLENFDSKFVTSTNTTGLAVDSETAAGYYLRDNAGNLPSFPADARNPSVEIGIVGKCDAGFAQIAGGYKNKVNGKYDVSSTFANLGTSNASHSKNMLNVDGDGVFAALAADQYEIRMLYASRPAEHGSTKAFLDQFKMVLTYDYGPDDVPDQFYFTDSVGPVSTGVGSNVITISGTTPGTPLSASFTSDGGGMTAMVNGATPYGPGVAFTLYNGDTVRMYGTTPSSTGASFNATITIAGVVDAWKITAGTDVPTNVVPPAPNPVTPCIPGITYPSKDYSPENAAAQAFWQLIGNTIPMRFHFAEEECEWALSSNGPWTTGTTEGEFPASASQYQRIYYRAKANSTPGESRTVTLVYSSQNLTSVLTLQNGDENSTHYVDLSPIQASQVQVPGWTPNAWYSPTPSGSMNHFTVGTRVQATSSGAGAQAQLLGEWWRIKSNGALPVWPVGTKITGVCMGATHNTSNQATGGTCVLQARCQNQATGAVDVSIGQYNILSSNLSDRNLTWWVSNNISASAFPMVPTGWTQQQLHDAIKADAFKWGHSGYIDTNVQLITGCTYKILRVYFQITKPPEGMTWEA